MTPDPAALLDRVAALLAADRLDPADLERIVGFLESGKSGQVTLHVNAGRSMGTDCTLRPPRPDVEFRLRAEAPAVPAIDRAIATLREIQEKFTDGPPPPRRPMEPVSWLEFATAGGVRLGLCSLCGNRGVIDTRGLRSQAGVEVGRLNYCVCPNGRAIKAGGGDLEAWVRDRR